MGLYHPSRRSRNPNIIRSASYHLQSTQYPNTSRSHALGISMATHLAQGNYKGGWASWASRGTVDLVEESKTEEARDLQEIRLQFMERVFASYDTNTSVVDGR